MKKILSIITAMLFLFATVSWAADATYSQGVYHKAGGDEEVVASGGQITVESGGELEVESGGIIDVESGGYFKLAGTAVTATAARLNMIPADGTVGQYLTTNGAGVWSWAAGTSSSLDGAYDVGAAITVDAAAVTLNGSHGTNDTFFINKTAGTGDAFQITNAGTGYDINGTSGTWTVSKTGAGVFSSLNISGSVTTSSWYQTAIAPSATGDTSITLDASGSGNITIGGTSTGSTLFPKAVSFTGNVDIGNAATDTLTITSVIDGDLTIDDGATDSPALVLKDATDETLSIVKTDAGYATFTTVAGDGVSIRTGNLTVGNGTAGVASMDGEDFYVEGDSEFDGTVQFDGIVTLGNAAVTLRANEAITLTHASNGAADDLIVAQTGANDASILLQSAGTGTDAIGLASSAGGVTITSTAVASAWTHTATGAADDLTLSVAGNQDASLILTSAGSGTDALTLSTTANAGDIVISSNDKIDIDSTGTFALNAAGDTLLIQVDSDGAADDLTIKVDGDDDSSIILDSDGTGADAVKIGATNAAGGIDVDAGTNGIDVLATGGAVTIGSTKNAASSIALTANGGASETIVVTNTQGTDAAAINLTATAGGITETVASGKAITLNGTTNLKVGSNVASPAGGELDLGDGNYFYITGTNNITSIAAADSTAGRMIILRFADILTFTDGGNLKLAGNLATTADDTITLMCDGTNWYEVARSAN